MESNHPTKLEKLDYYRNYLELLSQLSKLNPKHINYENFCLHYDKLNSQVYVIRIRDKVVATGSIFFEKKFIHNCGTLAHIEDIVVDEEYRNIGLCRKMLEFLKELAKEYNCYRIILNCNENMVKFYEKFDFKLKWHNLAIDL